MPERNIFHGKFTGHWILGSILCFLAVTGRTQDSIVQLVFTSDAHYGISRARFRGADSVEATIVNRAMIAAINLLPEQVLPSGEGVGAGRRVAYIDALVETGDIANRQEKGIQSAAFSWQQFRRDYAGLSSSRGTIRHQTTLWLSPGNHDVSNAVGFFKPMAPARDASSMVGIYNMMLRPVTPKTDADYDYTTDKIHYSRDIGGVHLLFVNLWPDSLERAWMEKDLRDLKADVPVFLFMHSPPDVESRFFINPNGDHGINNLDKFENLLSEQFRDGLRADHPALAEQRELAAFLKSHPNIKAWFHGHSNYNEFYEWHGPDNDLSLHCFRVDSPMKGKLSSQDETLLSFQLISIDTRAMIMTVRECLWNTSPKDPAVLVWGQHISVPIGANASRR